MTVYGPYKRKDGREHIIHYDEVSKTRRTQSYPRYLMELSLKRPLLAEEHVDHIDGNRANNNIDNLQLLSQSENNKKSMIERNASKKWLTFECPLCSKPFMIPKHRYISNQKKQSKKGPFCSKRCAGMAK